MGFPTRKGPFPATWGEEGVDVSKDTFIAPIGGKPVVRQTYVGASFKFPKEDGHVPLRRDFGDPDSMKKYICMVGKCSGIISNKYKKDKEEEE